MPARWAIAKNDRAGVADHNLRAHNDLTGNRAGIYMLRAPFWGLIFMAD
jgi:hypothetical protein